MPYLQRYMWKSKEPSNVHKDGDIVDNFDQSIRKRTKRFDILIFAISLRTLIIMLYLL